MPIRSASSSFWRVKLIIPCWVPASVPVRAAIPACGLAIASRIEPRHRPSQRRIALLIFHRAGEMPLRHVGDFVRHDRGQFALVIRVAEQGGVEDHIAAEEGEGVDLVVINQIEVERVRTELA